MESPQRMMRMTNQITVTKMNRRFITPEIRKIDKETRKVEFVASNGSVDSYGTVLPVGNWDLSRFEKNGIIGYQHNVNWTGDPDDVIGKGTARVDGDNLLVEIEFEPADLNEKADKIFRKIMFGSLNAVSVGFRSSKGHWGEESRGEDPDIYYYDNMELCEVSVVNIPANADAVKRSMDEERAALPAKPEVSGPIPQPAADTRSEDEPELREDNSIGDSDAVDICLTLAEAELALADKTN